MFLIDELDRTDEAFEAFLLEILSDFQVTVPELGTIKAKEPPIVIITTKRTREIHDALKRRCLLPLGRLPERQARTGNREPQGSGCQPPALGGGRQLHPEAPADRSLQGTRRGRDDRLGRCHDGTGQGGARSRKPSPTRSA